MEARVLRYFLAIVEEGSISRAARAVKVTQPSLSRQIRRLEAELGIELFARERNRLALTPAGRTFVPIAADVVTRMDQAVVVMKELGEERELLLTVVANVTTIDDILAPFAASRRESLLLDLRAEPTTHLNVLVREGAADLAVSAMQAVTSDLNGAFLRDFPLYACMSARHRWSSRSTISLVELLGERLIVLDTDSVARHVFDDAVRRIGAHYEAAFVLTLAQSAQALAACEQGVAVLTDDPRFDLRCLPIVDNDLPLTLPMFAAWSRNHYAEPRIAELVRELARFCAEEGNGTLIA